jgi:hypothetical protein
MKSTVVKFVLKPTYIKARRIKSHWNINEST